MMRLLLLVAAGVGVVGCGPTPDTSGRERIAVNRIGEVEIVNLADGTRCAIYHDARRGGIDCDWESKP